jgi:hypothetical protein
VIRLWPGRWLWALLVVAIVGGTVLAVRVASGGVGDGGSGAAGNGRPGVPSARLATVSCGSIIGRPRSGVRDGFHVVLGVVSVPPAYLGPPVAVRNLPWRHWQKAGLAVRAGRAVVVSVSKAWQRRAAITWGNGGIVSALEIAACPGPPGAWNAYAGGFYLRSRSGCVPLVFRVGRRSATVRFGIGRHCQRPATAMAFRTG